MTDPKEPETSNEDLAEEINPVAGVEKTEDEAVEEEIEALKEEAAQSEDSKAEEDSEPLSIEEQLEKAKSDARENYSNYLRAVADLDTYRRRVNREKDELRHHAVSGLLESLLPVYDNLGFGLASAEQAPNLGVVVQGLEMVLSQFKSMLEENGIAEIAPAKGDDFDHNQHEAMQTQPSDEVEDGKVLQLIRKGFSLNGKLIRAASVIVAGGEEVEAEKSQTSSESEA